METRKTIEKLKIDQVIEQQDDLTVTGNVDDNAQIKITDGSLIIHGNVEDGAHLSLKLSEELRDLFLNQNSGGGGVVINGNGGIFFGNNRNPENITAMCMSISNGRGTYSGNVRVGNRIFTNDQLVTSGGGKYEITAANNIFGSNIIVGGSIYMNGKKVDPSSGGTATATIDGKQYKGRKINVNGSTVIVDGVNMTDIITKETTKTLRKDKPVFIIHGNVGNNVVIDSDVDIQIKGRVGNYCQIKSEFSGINAKDIGEYTTVEVSSDLSVSNVAKKSKLKSNSGKIEAHNLGESVIANAHDNVNINDVNSYSELYSQYNDVNANNIANNVIVDAHDNIDVNKVGDNCNLKARYNDVRIDDNIGNKTTIEAHDNVKIEKNVGSNCKISANYDDITIHGNVGNKVIMKAHDNLKVSGNLGDEVELSSGYSNITVANVGSDCVIVAHDKIKAKDIGDRSNLTANYDSITVDNLGEKVRIQAHDNINVNGYCPDRDKLTSRYGKVKVANQSGLKPPCKSKPMHMDVEPSHINAYAQYERDMQQAIEESKQTVANFVNKYAVANNSYSNNNNNNNNVVNNNSAVSKQGLFGNPVVQEQPKNKEIPQGLCCGISYEIMEDPVICLLDGRSYDRKNITTWLKEHKTAPFNRKPLDANQPVDQAINQILMNNMAIKDMIDDFKKENPEMFKNAKI